MKKLATLALLLFSVAALGQFGQRRGGGGGRFNGGPSGGNCMVPGTRFGGDGTEDAPLPRKKDPMGFIYARVLYHPSPYWREGTPREVPWHHDYPDGDTEFASMLGRLTTADSPPENFQLVEIDSKELFKYPFVYMSEPGYLDLYPADAANLREYLNRGGFLLVDDFRGNEIDNSEWENFVVQMKKVFPDRDMQPVPPSHPIFHVFYDVDAQNILPPYRMRNSGEPRFMGLSDAKGNLQVMVDFNNDMSEYWQALDVGSCSIHEAGAAVELGVNYAIYAITH